MFGFVEASPDDSIAKVTQDFKGKVQVPSPIFGVDEDQEFLLILTNVGLLARPDLDDSHTIHWHGFRNPIALFDGVPEVSIAVPVYRDFPYVYKPRDEGTYMYHCHFEDSEHVQMGMTGVVFVRPDKGPRFAYDDTDGSTAFEREFTLLLNEIDQRPHDGLEQIQEFVWSDYEPQYWIINGRSYPDTVALGGREHAREPRVPADLFAHAGEPGRPRPHAPRQPRLRAAGDAARRHPDEGRRRGRDVPAQHRRATDLSYGAHTIYIGPGESRDIIFTSPPFDVFGARADGRRRELQPLLLRQPELVQEREPRRAGPRRPGDRGACVRRRPAPAPDGAQPDLCLGLAHSGSPSCSASLLALSALAAPAGAAVPRIIPASVPGNVVCTTGPTFDLTARAGRIQTPDGNSVYMWGYAPTGGIFQIPGPVLCVNEGDTVTVNLTSPPTTCGRGDLDLVFPGQLGVTSTDPTPGLLAGEADPGGTVSYSFAAGRAGTYLYESGTEPSKQVEMGLYGAIIVRPALGA